MLFPQLKLIFFLIFLVFLFSPLHKISAYYTGIAGTNVIGQPNLILGKPNQGGAVGANTVNNPSAAIVVGSKLLISDNGNNRILIYNTIPSTFNTSADVVIGQSNFTTNASGCSQNRLKLANGSIFSTNGKLFVADMGNNRILIYNTIPTSPNANANVVIGQQNFTSCGANQNTSANSNSVASPSAVLSDGNKLVISDTNNNRVLMYNTIPTSANANANVVIGQQNFTSNQINQGSSNPSANTLSGPIGVALNADNRFVIADNGNNRILNFNSIPSKTNTLADSVIGQSNFTTATLSGNSSANTITPFGVSFDQQGKLYSSDSSNNRVLIYDAIPASNNPSADIVIGQLDFASNGSFFSGDGLQSPEFIFATPNQLFIADSGNNRVVSYPNASSPASISLAMNPVGQPDGFLQELSGTSTVNNNYTVKNVEYSVNNGTWNVAQPSDGIFNDDSVEPFFIDFDPTANNNQLSGYTLRVRSFNNNGDVTANAFHFDPFEVNSPTNNAFIDTSYPTFTFIVNEQIQLMKENLSKYQIQIRPLNSTVWTTYIDNIPVNFASVAINTDNKNASQYLNQNTKNNGDYENSSFKATYSQQGSNIQIQAKEPQEKLFTKGGKALPSGAYKWRVLAYDNSGNVQTTPDEGLFRVNSNEAIHNSIFFPLSVLYITGLGNINFSSIHPEQIHDTYTINSTVPTFYGIAPQNAQLTLQLSNTSCTDASLPNCSTLYTTTANQQSRFGINVPADDLSLGNTYTVLLSATMDNNYVELSPFTLEIGAKTASKSSQNTLSMPNDSSTSGQSSMKELNSTARYFGLAQKAPASHYCGVFFCI